MWAALPRRGDVRIEHGGEVAGIAVGGGGLAPGLMMIAAAWLRLRSWQGTVADLAKMMSPSIEISLLLEFSLLLLKPAQACIDITDKVAVEDAIVVAALVLRLGIDVDLNGSCRSVLWRRGGSSAAEIVVNLDFCKVIIKVINLILWVWRSHDLPEQSRTFQTWILNI